MSGPLVIAELEAFRTVLEKATGADCDQVRLWSRSTIANALHRVGPVGDMTHAAEQAWSDADAFADRLARKAADEASARTAALASLDQLIATVKAKKAAMRCGDEPLGNGPVERL